MIKRTGPSRPVNASAVDEGAGSAARDGGTDDIDVTVGVECAEPVDARRWASLFAAFLAAEGVGAGAQAGLTFVSAEAMAALNATHMGFDGPTDVLAFPVDGRDASGADGVGPHGVGPPGVVGDIVICPSVAAAQASEHAGDEAGELALLIVHGALHLLGHDHALGDDREHMQRRERALLAALHGPLAGDPWRTRW